MSLGDAETRSDETFIAYMCRTDWDHDARGAPDGAKIYPSEASVLRARSCATHCGIVAVRVSLERVTLVGTDEEGAT